MVRCNNYVLISTEENESEIEFFSLIHVKILQCFAKVKNTIFPKNSTYAHGVGGPCLLP